MQFAIRPLHVDLSHRRFNCGPKQASFKPIVKENME